MVLEAGEQGKRWHIHKLLPGYIKQSQMKAIWEKVVGEKGLNVNFRMVENNSIGAWYVSKYLRKDGGTVTGVRRFRTSKGLRSMVQRFIQEDPKPKIWMEVNSDGGCIARNDGSGKG